jgi:hypothetical protein
MRHAWPDRGVAPSQLKKTGSPHEPDEVRSRWRSDCTQARVHGQDVLLSPYAPSAYLGSEDVVKTTTDGDACAHPSAIIFIGDLGEPPT